MSSSGQRDTTAIVDSLSVGSYNVIVVDTNFCESNSVITIIQPDSLILDVDSSNVSCFAGEDGFIDLTVNGGVLGYSYLWSNGITDQDIESLILGTYNVIVTDTNGCIDSIEVTLTQPIAPIQYPKLMLMCCVLVILRVVLI